MDTNSPFNPSLSANIPALITNLDQWLVWKSQPRIGQDNKFTKVPYNLRTALPSDPTSADTWATFDQAIQATGYDGIGLAINQPIGLLLIDLDNCIVDGVVQEWAAKLIQICDTYTEYSPSRLGFHLILEGQKLVDKTRFHHKQVEIYDSKRFLTITGDVYQERKEINDSTAELLFQYLAQISPAELVVKAQSSIATEITEVNQPIDRAILAKIRSHPEYHQDWNDLSERDARLSRLTNFYTGNNFDQTERILLATEFFRPKWSDFRKHPTVEDQKITYLRYQIEKNPSANVYQEELIPLYRNKQELNQVLLPQFRDWFTSDERRIDVVAVTPGGGKTYTATQALVQCCQQNENFVGILAQNTNKRVLEEQQSIQHNFAFEAHIIQGRDPNQGSSGFCRNYPEAERIGQAELSTAQILCKSACQFREECEISGYYSQFNQDGQLYIAPYESAINFATYRRIPNVIVFDENPMRPTAIKQYLTTNDLIQYRHEVKSLYSENGGDLIDLTETLLSMIDQQLRVDSNRSFKRGQEVIEIFQALNGDDQLQLNQREEWLNQLQECQRRMRVSHSCSLMTAKTVQDVIDFLTFPTYGTEITLKKKKTGSSSFDCGLQLNKFNDYIHRLPAETNMTVLDAYAEESTFARLLNSPGFNYHQFDIEINLHTTHITRNTNKYSLRQMDDQEMERIFLKFFQQFKPQSLLIYTYKREVNRVERIVENIKPDVEVAYSWFYRDRGSNQFKGYQSVIIFGSACPDTDELISELNSQYIQPINDDKENGVYQDYRLRQGIVEKQHHEIKQCIHRIRPTDNARKSYLFFSNFQIDGLKVDQKINYQQWAGEELSPKRREDYEIYGQLVTGVVDEVGFYAVKFQSDAELRNGLIKNQDLRQMMEHLCQDSKYGQSFSKFNGNRIRRDLAQITQELELKESKLRLLKGWKYKTWIKIYSLDPGNFKQLELSTFQVL